ncbi:MULTISPECIES: class III lanthipeptide [Shouchella]|uniref:Uncharacterized protein n=3 Tax=Shouchella TaxID=2893057 RepID=A0A060LSE8_9BACI|nr:MULTISPECIES: class III lanthipeptide [Bacillaceae]AIC93062.1 hypothetical protein BleG1_0454 [Shouchella lehensis G1]MED4128849.1 class III lanthipeptide [Shouchella miscanthi]WDF01985.1 class III lanthipeptide [Shouchella hunanensis]
MNQVLELQKLATHSNDHGQWSVEKSPATVTITTTAVGWSTASNDC